MKRKRQQFAIILAVIVVASTSGCSKTPGYSFVGSGGSRGADGGWFSAGTMFLQSNERGVLFGMQKTPNSGRSFAYFVLFTNSVTDDRISFDRPGEPGVSSDGKVVSMHDGITINGSTFELNLTLEKDEVTSKLSSRTLRINNESIDPTKGRVFLVDLTSNPVTYKQIEATLPSDLSDPTHDTTTVESLARQTTQQLKDDNESVREFLGK